MRTLPNSTAVLSIRDEGPFLLEWIAWYRMLGFADILIVHNDCTDHSPQLLRLLEREGRVVQKVNSPSPDRPPQQQNHELATRHRLVREADWVFVADTDEFLVVHAGDGSVAALAETIDGRGMGMAINWRIFGSAGEAEWRDTFVHRRFTRAAAMKARQNSCYKTFFKQPASFGKLRSHGPCNWQAGGWGRGERMFLLADGTPFADYHPTKAPKNATPRDQMTNTLAQVNHYAVQTLEQFAHKKGNLCGGMLSDRYTDDFFRRFDRNEEENTAALAHAAEFDAEYARLVAIPGVLRLHHLCCADYVERICRKRGDDPEADPRYRMHRARARALPHH